MINVDTYSGKLIMLVTQEVDMRPSRTITVLFLVAGQINIAGILVFSKFLTNTQLMELFPTIFNRFGLVQVILWGCAFTAVAWYYYLVPGLIGVFAAVKAVYFGTWIYWISGHYQAIPTLFEQSPLTAIHYLAYGPNDLLMCLFFGFVARYALYFRPGVSFQTATPPWTP